MAVAAHLRDRARNGFLVYLDDLHLMLGLEERLAQRRRRLVRAAVGLAEVARAPWTRVTSYISGQEPSIPETDMALALMHEENMAAVSRTIAIFEELWEIPEARRVLERSRNLVDGFNVHESHSRRAEISFLMWCFVEDVLTADGERAALISALTGLVSGSRTRVTLDACAPEWERVQQHTPDIARTA